jgi:hypothetical protein
VGDVVNRQALNAKWQAAKPWLIPAACVVAVLWVVGCFVIYSNMRKPPEQFGRFMTRIPAPVAFLAFPFESMWMRARAGTLKVGDAAPDFQLAKIDKSAEVRLSELNQTKPVVLVFGSYT